MSGITTNIESESFNKEKFKQVLHFIIHLCGALENVGKTVLFKLLYFSDLDYYELHEEKLTGETYYKLQMGPAPSHFDDLAKELEEENKVNHFETEYGGYSQHKYISVTEPDISLLSATELQLIEKTIKKCESMNATQISAYSHMDMPYKATEEGEVIDYELVFYRDELFSVRVYEGEAKIDE